MADQLERLKVLIESSTPIVVMETVEETRAVRLVRAACSSLDLALFEWSIATGLTRCGATETLEPAYPIAAPATQSYTGTGHDPSDVNAQALYNSVNQPRRSPT